MKNLRWKSKRAYIKIVGLILSESYQRSRILTEKLHKHHKKDFLWPSITGLLDMDWVEYLHKLRKDLGGQTWAIKESVVVFLNGSFLGGEQELLDHFKNYLYKSPPLDKIREYATKEYTDCLNRNNLLYVYLQLSLDDEYMGTLLFQLRSDTLPRSSLWFSQFCSNGKYTYKGTKVHRICRRGWFQAGEVQAQSEGWINKFLDDESYSYKHDRRGILSFANDGKHKNKFQFFVTFEAAEWMDGKYVAFGRLVEGADVLRRLECTPCTYERPDREITISDCGIAKVGLGRAIDPNLKLKGITVGEPHIDLEFFVEMIFSKFDEAILERLDEEVKTLIRGEWMMEIVWKKTLEELAKIRPPVGDILDDKDRSSRTYLESRYFAGLYDLQDIPDLFIKALLNKVIDKVIERSDIESMARSVVNFLIDNALEQATGGTDQLVQDIVELLIKRVFKIISGSKTSSEIKLPSGVETIASSKITFKTVLFETPDSKEALSLIKSKIGLEGTEEHTQPSGDQLSTKGSVVTYIWKMLVELLQNLEVPEEQ